MFNNYAQQLGKGLLYFGCAIGVGCLCIGFVVAYLILRHLA